MSLKYLQYYTRYVLKILAAAYVLEILLTQHMTCTWSTAIITTDMNLKYYQHYTW